MRGYCGNVAKRWGWSWGVLTILWHIGYVSGLSGDDLMIMGQLLIFRGDWDLFRLMLLLKKRFIVIVLLLNLLIGELLNIILLLHVILIKFENVWEVSWGWEGWGMWSWKMLLDRGAYIILVVVVVVVIIINNLGLWTLDREVLKLSRLLKLWKSAKSMGLMLIVIIFVYIDVIFIR